MLGLPVVGEGHPLLRRTDVIPPSGSEKVVGKLERTVVDLLVARPTGMPAVLTKYRDGQARELIAPADDDV